MNDHNNWWYSYDPHRNLCHHEEFGRPPTFEFYFQKQSRKWFEREFGKHIFTGIETSDLDLKYLSLFLDVDANQCVYFVRDFQCHVLETDHAGLKTLRNKWAYMMDVFARKDMPDFAVYRFKEEFRILLHIKNCRLTKKNFLTQKFHDVIIESRKPLCIADWGYP
jgi:hypothetical protein